MASSSIYSPLPTSTSIRILNITPIEPSSPTDPKQDAITYTFKVVDLSDSPIFRALSYTWGEPYREISDEKDVEHPPVFSSRIILNATPVMITQNLFSALESFRNMGIVGHLWVDAVCINQADLEERSAQVQLMCKIYSSCYEVLAWLGPHREEIEEIIWMSTEFLLSLDSAFPDLENSYYLVLPDSNFRDPAFWEKLGQNDGFKRMVKAAEFYHSCCYFSRAWIFQEMVLARRSNQGKPLNHKFRHLRMICGLFEINVPRLITAVRILDEQNWSKQVEAEVMVSHDIDTFSWFTEILFASSIPENDADTVGLVTQWGPTWITFLTGLLHATRYLSCFDSRDKIFSMLGILEAAYGPVAITKGLRADYTQDYKSLFKQFTALVLEDSGFLDILADTRRHENADDPGSESSLGHQHRHTKIEPSWAMNFLSREETNNFVPLGLPTFHAPLCEQPNFPKFEIIGNEISCYGGYFDTITDLTWRPLRYVENPVGEGTQLDFLEFYLSRPQNINNLSRFEAFVNTVYIDLSLHIGETQTQIERNAKASRVFKALVLDRYADVINADADGQSAGILLAQLERLMQRLILEEGEEKWGSEASEIVKTAMGNGGNCFQEILRSRDKEYYGMSDDDFRISVNLYLRRIFVTKRGLLGLGLSWLEEGDEVWLLQDAHTPFVLRPIGVKDKYTVVGACYMYGFMNGELLEDKWGVKENIRTITLV